MELLTPDLGLLLWTIFITVLFISFVLFFLAQYRALKAISESNREISPVEVWFQLLPVFNIYWQFVVVTRIADSLAKELVSLELQDDSILGVPDFDAVGAVGHRPTYTIGMAWCILLLSVVFLGWMQWSFDYLVWLQLAALLAALTCWVLYWVKLVQCTRKIRLLRKAASIGG